VPVRWDGFGKGSAGTGAQSGPWAQRCSDPEELKELRQELNLQQPARVAKLADAWD